MSNNNIKMEFLAKFSCQNCENVLENIFKNEKNIDSFSIDKNKGTVIVETNLSTTQVKKLLMNACEDVVLRGVSTMANGMKGRGFGSGVSIIQGSNNDVVGVVRLFQVSDGECIAEGTVGGLPPDTSHTLSVHELGDLSEGCSSCGNIYQSEEDEKKGIKTGIFGTVESNETGRLSFRLSNSNLKLWNVIGRSLVLQSNNQSCLSRLACGIIARSAGIQTNEKKVCACSGRTIWEEKEDASIKHLPT